jgi:hypothetical protein
MKMSLYNKRIMLPTAPKQNHIVTLLQKEFPGYHPLLSIARIAHKEGVDVQLQFDCHKVIAKYIEPELKSIEMSGNVSNERRVSVSLFDPEMIEDVIPKEANPKAPLTLGNW